MKKLIILFLLITGYSFAQDPFGKGNQTPIGFYTNYIDTATTSSGTATLNKLAGVVTTDNLNGTSNGFIAIKNSYITTSSVILITGSGADYQLNPISLGIVSQTTGQITLQAILTGEAFTTEIQIHFLIIN